jgi:hypothetical protein
MLHSHCESILLLRHITAPPLPSRH